MKIDFTKHILDQKGKPIPVDSDQLAKPEAEREYTTLQTIAEQALLSQFPDEQALPAADKVKRWRLFNKIGTGTSDLSAEEVTLLKLVIGKGFTPLVVGRAYDLIEPEVL